MNTTNGKVVQPEDAGLRDVPSHSPEDEAIVLGCVLIDPGSLDALPDLRVDDFYVPRHVEVYRTIVAMHARREPIGEDTVATTLRQQDPKDTAWEWAGFVSKLAGAITTTANVAYHAKRVREQALLRRTMTVLLADYLGLKNTPPQDIVSALDRTERRVFEATRPIEPEKPSDMVSAVTALYQKHVAGHDASAVSFGFEQLDAMTGGGMRPGDLVLIAARPGSGKTSAGLNIMSRLARRPDPVAAVFFSLEMPREELVRNMACIYGQVDTREARSRGMSRDAEDRYLGAFEAIEKWPCRVEEHSHLTPSSLRAIGRRHKSHNGIGVVMVDYLQLVRSASDQRGRSRQDEVSEVSRGLKELAVELHVPVIAMAQLNRNSEERIGGRPRLADLRESGQLEQDASLVILLHREDLNLTPEQADHKGVSGKAEWIVAKNRWGPTGTIHLRFEARYGIFSEPHAHPTNGTSHAYASNGRADLA